MAFSVSDLKPDLTHPLNELDVTCLALSPDRKFLMAAMTSSEVRVYDVADWSVAHSWKTDGPVSECAWSPDQTRLGLTVGSQVEIWDVAKQQRQHTAPKGGLPEWTADGKQLLSAAGATPWQIDSESGETKQTAWSSAQACAYAETCVSSDGKLFSTNGSSYDTLFDAESGCQLWNRKQSQHARHARFGPGNQEMAIDGRGAGAEIRRVSDWQTRLQVEGYRPELTSDGLRILVQLGDGKFAIRSTKDGSLIQEFAVPTGESLFGCWSPDDRLVAVRIGNSQTNSALHIWDTREGQLRSQIDFPLTPTKDVREVLPVWKNTERLLVPFGGAVYDVSADDLSDWTIWPTKSLAMHALAFSPQSNRALLFDNGMVWLTDENGQAKQSYQKPWSGRLFALPDGRRFASSLYHYYDYPAHGFDAETQQDLGCCFSLLTNGGWLTIGPTGHYQGSEGVESEFVYVAEHLDGHQQTYTAAEFAKAFNWKNDTKQATFLKLVETKEVEPSEAKATTDLQIGLSFDGFDDYVEVPSLAISKVPFTIEAWIVANLEDQLTRQDICGWQWRAMLGVNKTPNDALEMNVVGQVWSPIPDVPRTPTLNSRPIPGNFIRHHVAMVVNEHEFSLFVNGQPAGSGSHDGVRTRTEAWDRAEHFAIGAGLGPSKAKPTLENYFKGRIEAVRVSRGIRYNDTFSPVDLTPDADAIALYDFAQGSGNVLKDISGNGHDGKIVGATWVKADTDLSAEITSEKATQ